MQFFEIGAEVHPCRSSIARLLDDDKLPRLILETFGTSGRNINGKCIRKKLSVTVNIWFSRLFGLFWFEKRWFDIL